MKYYSIHRPVGPGTFPKNGNVVQIHNFDDRQQVPEIGCEAWGWIEYSQPLTEKEAASYELVSEESKLWFAVCTSVYDNGQILSAIVDTKRAAIQPESNSKDLRRRTVYVDWFGTREEAQAAVDEAMSA